MPNCTLLNTFFILLKLIQQTILESLSNPPQSEGKGLHFNGQQTIQDHTKTFKMQTLRRRNDSSWQQNQVILQICERNERNQRMTRNYNIIFQSKSNKHTVTTRNNHRDYTRNKLTGDQKQPRWQLFQKHNSLPFEPPSEDYQHSTRSNASSKIRNKTKIRTEA